MRSSNSECVDHGFSTGLTKRGYKKVSHNGVQTYLHRVVLANKLHKPERELDTTLHSCDNPRCINPDHLTEGTLLDNITDMVVKGRHPRGMSHGSCKLTDADCEFIRCNWVFRHLELGTVAMASRFGVSPSAISRLLHSSNR